MKWETRHVQNARFFLKALKKQGFNFFTGVPCSLLGALIEELSQDHRSVYVPAVREDAALGMASGAFLAGRLPAVLMQNSGLGYSLNVLTSLNLIYKIPVLCLVSYRGFGPDAPEHRVMGKSCRVLLKEIGVPSLVLGKDTLPSDLRKASRFLKKQRKPFALFVQKGLFGA